MSPALVPRHEGFERLTPRNTETDVAAAQDDPDCFTLQVRLTDSFGDNGMVCVIICREEMRKTWMIDTWLMSCRVLGRGGERMVLREILHHAQNCGASKSCKGCIVRRIRTKWCVTIEASDSAKSGTDRMLKRDGSSLRAQLLKVRP